MPDEVGKFRQFNIMAATFYKVIIHNLCILLYGILKIIANVECVGCVEYKTFKKLCLIVQFYYAPIPFVIYLSILYYRYLQQVLIYFKRYKYMAEKIKVVTSV